MQQGGAGSPFGGPLPLGIGGATYPEAAAPISVRPPPTSSGFDDLGPQGVDEDHGMASCAAGNRWPRQETLALLKIRSDMDAAFRDATLKGPLWEEVSRKLAELGYHRSAKKCKEKFENVHKYYKRTKEGRAGRQDGKSYRFFSQLEALQGSSSSSATATATTATTATEIAVSASTPMITGTAADPAKNSSPCGPSPRSQHTAILSTVPTAVTAIPPVAVPQPLASAAAPAAVLVTASPPLALAGLSFSSNTSSYSGTESDNEDEEVEELGGRGERKRKREEGGGGGDYSKDSRKLMSFFEGLMKQVIDRQESMQQRFLEAIERREQDRMIREEAWRRQEITRISREHELAAQERAAAASRDATIIAFLQKLTGQPIPIPPPLQQIPTAATAVPVAPAAHTQTVVPPPPLPPPLTIAPQAPTSSEIIPIISEPPQLLELPQEPQPQSARGDGGLSMAIETASSRWPKSEVHALIQLRSEMEVRYQESGPKGPLWEEISAGMGKLGYNRSSKRCKEKWENINKYFKKVKESNKKRPEDAKTCPYFHQLDALYRSKLPSNALELPGPPEPQFNTPPAQSKFAEHLAVMAPPSRQQGDTGIPEDGKNNRGHPSDFLQEGSSSSMAAPKKPEGIVKKLMLQPHMVELEINNMEEDNVDEDDEDDDENGDMQFRIQYQRPRVDGGGGGTGAAGESNFLAMVR